MGFLLHLSKHIEIHQVNNFKCEICEMHLFSAINFDKDRVVDGNLDIVKDLLLSNYCEVSQNKHITKVVSSMKDVDENIEKINSDIVMRCDKDPRTHVEGNDQIDRKDISTNHMSDKSTVHDMYMDEEPTNEALVHKRKNRDGKVTIPHPNQFNNKNKCSKTQNLNNVIENYIDFNATFEVFDKQMATAFVVGKLLSTHGLCHNDIVPCLSNFVYYTHYLMSKLERNNGVKTPWINGYRREYVMKLQKQFLQDIDEALKDVNLGQMEGSWEKGKEQCILCSIVRSKKEEVPNCTGLSKNDKYREYGIYSEETVHHHHSKENNMKFTNCKCHNKLPNSETRWERKSWETDHSVKKFHCAMHTESTTQNCDKSDPTLSYDELSISSSMMLNDKPQVSNIFEPIVGQKHCNIELERDSLGHEQYTNGGRSSKSQVILIISSLVMLVKIYYCWVSL